MSKPTDILKAAAESLDAAIAETAKIPDAELLTAYRSTLSPVWASKLEPILKGSTPEQRRLLIAAYASFWVQGFRVATLERGQGIKRDLPESKEVAPSGPEAKPEPTKPATKKTTTKKAKGKQS